MRTTARRWRALGLAALLGTSACGFLIGLEQKELRDDTADASLDGSADQTVGTENDGSLVDGMVTDGGMADGPRDSASDARVDATQCPSKVSCPGQTPCSVVVRGDVDYCMDGTEVTNAQYKAFRDAVQGGASVAWPQECAWKGPLPNGGSAGTPNAFPVHSVDWCDAHAYCAWAGKRLCGRVRGGGTVPYRDLTNPSVDSWYFACSGGQTAYPYGAVYEAGVCNVALPAASLSAVPYNDASCSGASPGVTDQLGNVHEWEDACYVDGGGAPAPPYEENLCAFRGGAYGNDVSTVCAQIRNLRRTTTLPDIGIRCCSFP